MAVESLLEQKTTESIIGAFYHVYRRLGYGFLEQVTRWRSNGSYAHVVT
jgi:hypothetical protein